MKDSQHRITRYDAKTDGAVAGKRFDAVKIISRDSYAKYARFQATAESAVKMLCQDVSVVLLPRYINYALELCSKTSDQERRVTYDKWHARGLVGAKLRAIALALRSWTPSPDVMDVLALDGITHARGTSATYLTAWNQASAVPSSGLSYVHVDQYKTGPTYYIHRGYFAFDTSPLGPGALVLGATLRVKTSNIAGPLPFDVVVQSGLPCCPGYPAVDTDFNRLNYSGDAGSAPGSAFVLNAWTDIPFNQAGIALVSTTAYTRFVVRASTDISGTAPTAANYLYFYRVPGDANFHPHLLVYYYPD